ncbi:MAG: hypothetical protein MH321_09435 [Leptospiraceae bacterium]|nr:hypothetical protein [Leptospiraceae bacterium]
MWENRKMENIWTELLLEISDLPTYDMKAFLMYFFESKEDSEIIMSALY